MAADAFGRRAGVRALADRGIVVNAPERRCPDHDITSTDLVGVNSSKESVYRCVSKGIGNGATFPHFFTLREMKPTAETPKKRTKKAAK